MSIYGEDFLSAKTSEGIDNIGLEYDEDEVFSKAEPKRFGRKIRALDRHPMQQIMDCLADFTQATNRLVMAQQNAYEELMQEAVIATETELSEELMALSEELMAAHKQIRRLKRKIKSKIAPIDG